MANIPFWSNAGIAEELAAGQPGEEWNYVIISGKRFPGAVHLGGERKRRMNNAQAPGIDGAQTTHLGFDPSEMTLTITLWTETHMLTYAKLVNSLQARGVPPLPRGIRGRLAELSLKADGFNVENNRPPVPVSIVHPALAIMNIRSVYFVRLGILKPKSERSDIYIAEHHISEWKPMRRGQIMTPSLSLTNIEQNASIKAAIKTPSSTATGPTQPTRNRNTLKDF